MVCCVQRNTWITNIRERITRIFKVRSITLLGCLGYCIKTKFVVHCDSEIGRIHVLDCRWVADNRNIHRILVRISRDG